MNAMHIMGDNHRSSKDYLLCDKQWKTIHDISGKLVTFELILCKKKSVIVELNCRGISKQISIVV